MEADWDEVETVTVVLLAVKFEILGVDYRLSNINSNTWSRTISCGITNS